MGLKILECLHCKYKEEYKKGERVKCKAFPKGIPRQILHERILHYKILPNQKGKYIFTPKKEFENSYDKYFQRLRELISSRETIKEEMILLSKKAIEQESKSKEIIFLKFEITFDRGKSLSLLMYPYEIIFYHSKNKMELISFGYDSELIKNLNNLLLIENIENQKTDIEFTYFKEGNYILNFKNILEKERTKKKKVIWELQNKREKNQLLKRGFKTISKKELEIQLLQILEKEDKNNIFNDTNSLKILHEKGIAVILSEITKTRIKLGYKTKFEQE